jgi:UDP-N-acetylmuramoyl-tripeptide--D-alanyl-D-alanine ligase
MVKSLSLKQVADATGGILKGDVGRVSVSSVGTDSREPDGKSIFFALRGERFDGHAFLDEAAHGGAKAAVVCRRNPIALDFHRQRPAFPLVMVPDTLKALGDLASFVRSRLDIESIGITGTTGKTSTKDLLVSILAVENSVAFSRGSFNNEIGLPLTILEARKKDTVLVAEMGARRPGDIRRLCEIANPGVGLITNVGPGHLQLFKTLETVARTKGELARWLPSDGALVLNAADPASRHFARESRARVTRFGRGKGSAYRAETVRLDDKGRANFELTGPGFSLEVVLRAIGRHQVENAVAAAACAHVIGASPEAIKAGLETSNLSNWRTEWLECPAGYAVINDAYNANPRSMEAALRTLSEAAGDRRKIAVLGGMAELGSRPSSISTWW